MMDPAPLGIGGDPLNGQYFAGTIDNVRVYSQALSQSAIQADMNTAVGTTITPTVTSETPAPNATNVPLATTVTATFNESVLGSSITTSNFVLKDSNNNTVTATVSYSDSTHTATLTPSSPLAASATYTASISGVKDAAGNVMASPFTWSFTTTTTIPTVTGNSPASGATGVGNTTAVTATFNESVLGSSITTSNFVLKDSKDNTVTAAVSYTDSTHTATLTPAHRWSHQRLTRRRSAA